MIYVFKYDKAYFSKLKTYTSHYNFGWKLLFVKTTNRLCVQTIYLLTVLFSDGRSF